MRVICKIILLIQRLLSIKFEILEWVRLSNFVNSLQPGIFGAFYLYTQSSFFGFFLKIFYTHKIILKIFYTLFCTVFKYFVIIKCLVSWFYSFFFSSTWLSRVLLLCFVQLNLQQQQNEQQELVTTNHSTKKKVFEHRWVKNWTVETSKLNKTK